jgi:hypothetical protein
MHLFKPGIYASPGRFITTILIHLNPSCLRVDLLHIQCLTVDRTETKKLLEELHIVC